MRLGCIHAFFLAASVYAATSITPVAPKLSNGCYQIGTAAELYGFASIVNGSNGMAQNMAACGKLTANIVVNKNVIANDTLNGDGSAFITWTPMKKFSGTLDGQYHTISGLYMNGDEDAALILSVKPPKDEDTVTVKNLGIEDSYFFSRRSASGVIGNIDTGTVVISNVYSVAFVRGYYGTAGLVGNAHKGPLYVRNSYTFPPKSIIKEVGLIDGAYSETINKVVNSYEPYEHNVYSSTNTTMVYSSKFADGSIAQRLHNSLGGSAWGQNVGTDPHPIFSGTVTGYTGTDSVYSLSWHNVTMDNEIYAVGYIKGSRITFPIPVRDGYAFLGWFNNANLTGNPIEGIEYKTTGNLDLYAMWTPLPKKKGDCYEIRTEDDLYGFAAIVNGAPGAIQESCACGKLTADIALNEDPEKGYKPWFPISDFCGTFDGNGKSISGLYRYDTLSNMGFFGSVKEKYITYKERYRATIKNLEIKNVYFDGGGCIGALVGDGSGVDIDNCHTSGNLWWGSSAGGFAGCLSNASISHSYNEAHGSARLYVGGFVGNVSGDLLVTNSYNLGRFENYMNCCQDNNFAMFGRANGTITIENSYNMPIIDFWYKREIPSATLADEGSVDSAFNVFYYGSKKGPDGTWVSEQEFRDGTVAKLLHDYKSERTDGSIWGQNVWVDKYPTFKDSIIVASSFTPKTPKMVDGCYQIGSTEELYGFASIVNTSLYNIVPFCAKLTNDITMNKNVMASAEHLRDGENDFIQWTPIKEFDGEFDGQGHTISGLYFNDTTIANAGLFGTVFSKDSLFPTKIINVGITDSYIRSNENAGGLIGKIDTLSKRVVVKNCHSDAVADGYYHFSGLIGAHLDGILDVSESYTTRTTDIGVGSLVAYTTGRLNILNSYSIDVGGRGLVGYTPSLHFIGSDSIVAHISIENSYALSKDISTGEWMWVGLVNAPSDKVPIVYRNAYRYENIHGFVDPDSNKALYFEVTADQIKDGSLASALHMYKNENIDGAVWGQEVGVDEYPKLTGTISGAATVRTSPLVLYTFDGDTADYPDSYVNGIALSLPVPVRADYSFRGWYDNAEYSGQRYEAIPDTASGEKVFYAKWWHIPQVSGGCYAIGAADELHQFAEDYNRTAPGAVCVKLIADIVENKNVTIDDQLNVADTAFFQEWTPIKSFRGTFDGQGHTISGLYYDDKYEVSAGLFASIGDNYEFSTVSIKNLNIKDSYFKAASWVGSLVGISKWNTDLFVENVTSESIVEATIYQANKVDGTKVGGLIGYFFGESDEWRTLELVNVIHKGRLSSTSESAGGLVGSLFSARIIIVHASHEGAIYAREHAGGLIGEANNDCQIDLAYVYNEGSVEGLYIGGLVGSNRSPLNIYNAYNVGELKTSRKPGGIIGDVYGEVNLVNSFNMGKGTASTSPFYSYKREGVVIQVDNAFHLDSINALDGSTPVSEKEFTDFTLAKKLHDYSKGWVTGDGWTQKAGDFHPVFDTAYLNKHAAEIAKNIPAPSSSSMASSSSEVESSSSEIASSSGEVESSSSEVASSSGKVESSSSKVASSSGKVESSSSKVASSSSKKASSSSKGSSSSSVKKSSSSKAKTTIAMTAAPRFVIQTVGRTVQVEGSKAGKKYAVMDLQGRIITLGYTLENFSIVIPAAGTYLLRIDGEIAKVDVE